MAFQNYAEPIEYLVNNYLERKRFQSANSNNAGLDNNLTPMYGEADPKDDLPDIPCKIIRDSNGRAYKFIYGDTEALGTEDEASPVIWQQELVRNTDGQVEKIITTYPDGEAATETFVRDTDGKLNEYKLE